jgi:hypothetical protein
MGDLTYSVSKNVICRSDCGTLVDRGANGGIIGSDAIVRHTHGHMVDITGIDNHELAAMDVIDATVKVITQMGPAIIIMNEYAYYGKGRTLHSAGQIEAYNNLVYDRSMKIDDGGDGASQYIHTLDGYVIPIDIISGLPYIQMEPHTEKEWETLPHIILTGAEWDPTSLDNIISDKENWFDIIGDLNLGLYKSPFDEHGRIL